MKEAVIAFRPTYLYDYFVVGHNNKRYICPQAYCNTSKQDI